MILILNYNEYFIILIQTFTQNYILKKLILYLKIKNKNYKIFPLNGDSSAPLNRGQEQNRDENFHEK